MVVKTAVEMPVMVAVAMITNPITIPIASLYLQNYGNLPQLLLNPLFPNITVNIMLILQHAGWIPKALWDQVPQSQCHRSAKQQANSTTWYDFTSHILAFTEE